MFEAGQQFSHFEIIRKLGEGGMGEVYLAEDKKLNRKVALKILLAEALDDAERQARFQREAKSAAQVSHPNVMGIYDINSAKDPKTEKTLTYIVMELVEGKSLLAYMGSGKVDLASVVKLAEKTASGLAAAHKMGIVHRDIKADNIVVNNEGEPKILDFGLAKPASVVVEGDDSDATQTVEKDQLTRAGKIVGTVSYMSPEQARGDQVDSRSDIFSFGVLLYRMVTGEFPFTGPSTVSTLAKILETRHEPPHLKNKDIPAELERIIDKCLQKAADDRYQDTRDLVVDLRNLRRMYDSGTSDTISAEYSSLRNKSILSGARPRRLRRILIGVGVVAALSVVFKFSGESDSPALSTAQAQGNSLAILGFENKTGDASLDWLETGLPEILLTDLAQAEAITIISRERIIDCFPESKKSDHTFDECVDAASSLGAVNLLSGTFFKLGDKLRIDARLQDVATGNIIFGEKVIGDDPFTLVDSLTAKIAASLNITRQMEQDKSVSTFTSSSPEAYKHYRIGLDKMYSELYEDAIDEFNKALAIDSTFALPYMRIGMSLVFQERPQEGAEYFALAKKYESSLPLREQSLLEIYADIWLDPQYDKAFIKMESFVKRYPDDKEGHTIYGLMIHSFTGDTTRTFAHLDTALQLDPSYQLALSLYASYYRRLSMLDEAVKYAETSRKYHPESPDPYLLLSRVYTQRKQYDKAIAELTALLKRYPDHSTALIRLSDLYITRRDFDKAMEYVEELGRQRRDDPFEMYRYYLQRADIVCWKGQFKADLALQFDAYKIAVQTEDSTYVRDALNNIAQRYHRYGQPDSALFYLKEADKWATAMLAIDYPLAAVEYDHTKYEELLPRFEESMEAFRLRLPSNLMYLVDAISETFHARGRADTAALIDVIEQKLIPAKSGTIRGIKWEAGILRVKTGAYEAGHQLIEDHLAELNEQPSAERYLMSQYYLGIAEEGLGKTKEAIARYKEVLEYWGNADIETDPIKDVRRRLAALTS